MCLMINEKTKPPCAKSRKFVYKVVRKHVDCRAEYRNIFFSARPHVYCLGRKTESDRNLMIKQPFFRNEHHIVTFGFHALNSKRVAKKLLNNIIRSVYDYNVHNGKLDTIADNHWYNYKIAIIKCAVDFEDHIADGDFTLDPKFTTTSSVYDKLIPVEEVFVEKMSMIDLIRRHARKLKA